jgi:DNA repair exonuclease SbcCD nuclease subunit
MGDDLVNNDRESDTAQDTALDDNRVITVVLTADNHLGYTGFGQHPRKREERQQRLRHAFQQAADFAIVQGVDLFIQAGDLFDTTMPDERDRSFIAERLAQLKQAGVQTFALGGVHDTPAAGQSLLGNATPAPQMSYASLGALHYLSPTQRNEAHKLEPVFVDVHGITVGICGLGVLPGQLGDPLADLEVSLDIERAAIPILILHAPIEGLTVGSSLLETRAVVSKNSLRKQSMFRYIFAGYHHNYSQTRVGQTDLVVAGATQYIDFSTPDQAPGFVFLGLAADGIRWCNHISVDALSMRRLTIQTAELWPEGSTASPTEIMLERLRPLCDDEAMILLSLQGELARSAYHLLDLNQIRRYGEEHCFALAIDDSALSLLHASEDEQVSPEMDERLSLREELSLLADERIASATDENEKSALHFTKEELLLAIDEIKNR